MSAPPAPPPPGGQPHTGGERSPSAGAGEVAPVDAPAFAPFAAALGVPVPEQPAPLAEADELEELELAARVLDHCRRHKLGPASSPSLSLRILNLVAAPDAEISELARVISADPALSAGVLNVANSAFYRGLDESQTVRDAVTRLGLDEVGRVAGALSAKTLFNPRLKLEQQAFGPRFTALYRRAVTVGTGAAALAMRQPGARSDRAYLGGMLHDVGRTVALRAVALLTLDGALALELGSPRLERLLDQVHLELGGELHQEWQMPQYLTVLAVRHHDQAIPAEPEFLDLHVVRLAAAVYDLKAEPASAWRAAGELVQSAAALRLDPNAVRALASELAQAEQRVATTLGLEGGAAQRRR
ncbi:MAG: HDOD domain-containing protein [Anaeromyxobacter sp.]|nr:HDOD domain-containing protein [Anaeromyxobacter sp.]MBL0276371.1 HDOD domain-containing protein [Anaeromyxobacter sp.]